MNKKIIAYDLGTSGNKASLYDADGECMSSSFYSYESLYPGSGMHEQRPADWWESVVASTRRLLEETNLVVLAAPANYQFSADERAILPWQLENRLLSARNPLEEPFAWLETNGGGYAAKIEGPENLFLEGSPPMEIPLTLDVDREARRVRVDIDGESVDLEEGRISAVRICSRSS